MYSEVLASLLVDINTRNIEFVPFVGAGGGGATAACVFGAAVAAICAQLLGPPEGGA